MKGWPLPPFQFLLYNKHLHSTLLDSYARHHPTPHLTDDAIVKYIIIVAEEYSDAADFPLARFSRLIMTLADQTSNTLTVGDVTDYLFAKYGIGEDPSA